MASEERPRERQRGDAEAAVRAAVLAEREAVAALAEQVHAFYEESVVVPGVPGRVTARRKFADLVRGRPAP
jgi:hypothetical protein